MMAELNHRFTYGAVKLVEMTDRKHGALTVYYTSLTHLILEELDTD